MKTIVLITLLAALITVGLVKTFSFSKQQQLTELKQSKERGRLKWYAQMGKLQGNQQIVFRSGYVRYAVAKNLDEALHYYTLVKAKVIGSKAYAANPEDIGNSEDIETWYKLQITETLSQQDVTNCQTCPPLRTPPADMLPLNKDEFLVPQAGGEISIDGVKMISEDPEFPPFKTGDEYLLFLTLDMSKGVGALRMGPWGVYNIGVNETLTPVNKELEHPLKADITARSGDSVGRLRAHLKTRH
ncbi:MAG TPA: hypothetical protein VGO91_01475 [Pyrinomonadaceae bacterium]|jgi:hypothetical protein|nr:hypothetical protein [Pyrinomonadaceae bacterium]